MASRLPHSVGGINLLEIQPWSSANTENTWALSGVRWKGTGDMCVTTDALTGYLMLSNCDARATQLWDWDYGVKGRIRQTGTNKCVNVTGAGTANGTRLGLYPCGTPAYPNEQFTTTARGELKYGGKCVDVNGYYPVAGASIDLWDCTTNPLQFNEMFHLTGTVKQSWYGDCLDMLGATSTNRSAVGTYPCVAGAPNQEWDVYFK
jgi:hypothetical protein